MKQDAPFEKEGFENVGYAARWCLGVAVLGLAIIGYSELIGARDEYLTITGASLTFLGGCSFGLLKLLFVPDEECDDGK